MFIKDDPHGTLTINRGNHILIVFHLHCCREHIINYDTNVLKQMLRILLFCHVNIFIQNVIQFFGVYIYRYILYYITCMTGLPLRNSKHEHNAVNTLCSLKKLSYYNKFLPPHNGHGTSL